MVVKQQYLNEEEYQNFVMTSKWRRSDNKKSSRPEIRRSKALREEE